MEIIKKNGGEYECRKDNKNLINFSPSRGGIITNWVLNNREILYFDKKRFFDKNKSIRGGIPILFPICGNLEKKSLFGDNFLYLMQHGFARDQQWSYEFNQFTNNLYLILSDN